MARVLWVSVETPDRDGQGGQRRQFHQIRALRELGHDITVLVPASAQSDRTIREIARVMRPRVSIRGRIIALWLDRTRRRVLRGTWSAVILSHQGSWWLLPSPDQIDIPVLVDIHNVKSFWFRSSGDEIAARQAVAEEESALGYADLVTVCSAIERDRLISEHPGIADRVLTARLGIDPKEWPDQEFSRVEPLVGLFGSWDWPPNTLGLDWFLGAVWPHVRAAVPRAVARVAGSGVVQAAAWPDGAQFVGRVDDLAAFTAQATVLAVPVMNGVGASVKFAEALASGAAVVATRDGANSIPDAPALVSDDPIVWADWIIERLRHRATEPAPAESRAYAIEQLTWEAAVAPLDAWLDAYGTTGDEAKTQLRS